MISHCIYKKRYNGKVMDYFEVIIEMLGVIME
jgi:hypothetical protein